MKIPQQYLEKVYAGWLGKIIGIRLGAAIEGWTYEKIQKKFGELWGYPVDFRDFAADDDSNGPLFFLRALEDCQNHYDITPQDVGEALLNYAPYEHGFFWWGGYGISTEHTAYLNLRRGIPAPQSGSIEQNGATIAEQIGGQIFIDTWGLVAPGNPDLAAKYARAAASVTHDGNGIYGGIFIAVCISLAFVENDVNTIIEKALQYIPEDCEYTRVVRAVMDYHADHPEDWRGCYQFLFENFGYDKYPGNCHIIPNSGVILLALLYGKGDFSDSINICNMCGWDTDCNVANVGTIIGVKNGLAGIDYDKWRKPINDFLACSGVLGSFNIMDIPYGASYIAKLAYAIAGEEIPEPMKEIIENRIDSCHFEYPGSTHAIRVRLDSERTPEIFFKNTDEAAFTGNRCLKATVKPVFSGEQVYLYKKTYYRPEDFHDSRYDPFFSPILYPGQTVHCSVMVPEGERDFSAQIYVKEGHSQKIITGEAFCCKAGEWKELTFAIPPMESGRIDEAGVLFTAGTEGEAELCAYIDDLYFTGVPDYTIDFDKENVERWNDCHKELSQFSVLKGSWELQGNQLQLCSDDFAEVYTGHHDFKDYMLTTTIQPVSGEDHRINLRVQGAIRSYAVGFCGKDKLALLKNSNGYRTLQEVDFPWEYNHAYTFSVTASGNRMIVKYDNEVLIDYTDEEKPYLHGAVGLSVENNSTCKFSRMEIKGLLQE